MHRGYVSSRNEPRELLKNGSFSLAVNSQSMRIHWNHCISYRKTWLLKLLRVIGLVVISLQHLKSVITVLFGHEVIMVSSLCSYAINPVCSLFTTNFLSRASKALNSFMLVDGTEDIETVQSRYSRAFVYRGCASRNECWRTCKILLAHHKEATIEGSQTTNRIRSHLLSSVV